MVDGNRKGGEYMLDVCRLLSQWVAGTPRDAKADRLVFRTRSTALMPIDGHWKTKGDLVSRPDLDFPLCIECKKVEVGGALDGLFDEPKWPFWKWWEQTKSQALAIGETPSLIFCRNRRENRVVLPTYAARCLEVLPISGPMLDLLRPDGEALTVCLLDDLLAVPKQNLRRLRVDALVAQAKLRVAETIPERRASSAGTTSSGRSLKRTGSRSLKRTRSG